jgi:hypothetical protein
MRQPNIAPSLDAGGSPGGGTLGNGIYFIGRVRRTPLSRRGIGFNMSQTAEAMPPRLKREITARQAHRRSERCISVINDRCASIYAESSEMP